MRMRKSVWIALSVLWLILMAWGTIQFTKPMMDVEVDAKLQGMDPQDTK